MQESDRNKYFRVVHIVFATIWLVLAVAKTGHIEKCYDQYFNRYLSYSIFKWSVIMYMFLGHFLLGLLYKFFNLWAYLIFESILILIILVYFKIYISC